MTHPPPQHSERHYVIIGQHPDPAAFNPFDPDLLGAIREAYAWIANPQRSTGDTVEYRAYLRGPLMRMLERAMARP